MRALIVLVLLCLTGAGLSAKLRCSAEEGILLSVFGMTAAAYAMALVGILPLAGFLPWATGLAGVVFLLISFVRGHREALAGTLSGTLLFAAAALVLWWLCRGCALSGWDDFSHWGYALKVMFYTGDLYTAPAYVNESASYPPASTLWQYVILRAAGAGYREDIALWANGLFSAAGLLTAVKAMQRQRVVAKAAVYALLSVIVLQIFPRSYSMLSIDTLLGIVTAAVLLAEFLPERSRVTPWLEILGCFVLCHIKGTGFGFALLIIIAAVLRRASIFRSRRRAGDPRLLPFATPTAMLAAALAAQLSWAMHLKLMGVSERWQVGENILPALWDLAMGRGPSYRGEVCSRFLHAFFMETVCGGAIPFPYIGWFVIALALGVLAFVLIRREDRRLVCAGVGTALGIGAVFTVSLLYIYLFVFHQTEALALSSFHRYLTTACTVMMTTGVAFACTALSFRRLPVRSAVVVCLALLAALSGPPEYLVDAVTEAPIHAAQTNHDAYLFRRAALRIRSLGVESPRLYLITAYDWGLTQLRVGYELLPWRLPPHGTMLMTENSERVLGSVQCTWQEWRQVLLDDYDYVYIFCPETQFVREFLPVFEDESQVVVDRMFRVIHTDADGILRTMPEITADPEPPV